MPLILASEQYGEAAPDGATPMLVAHGLFGAGRNWMTLAKRFAQNRAVATVDMRNHGASPWEAEMDYRAMGADLLHTAQHLFGRPAILLGHSMGGKASMAAALSAPDQVAALLVADIAPIAYPDHAHGRYVKAMCAADLSTATKRSEIEPQLQEAIPEPSLRAFILANLLFEDTPQGRRPRWRINLDVIGARMDDLTGWPEALDAARYAGPSFFLHGAASDYVAPDGRAKIERLFPQATIDNLPGAGHWLHAEKPDAFAERVEAWLAQLDASGL